MMARSTMLQSKAGYIDARPFTASSTNLLATRGRTIHWGQKRRFDRRPTTSGPPGHSQRPSACLKMPIASFGTAAKQAATRSPRRSGASSVGAARRSSITRLLLRRHYPDAAHLALLNEFNKSNVGLVECIVPHWGASLSGFSRSR